LSFQPPPTTRNIKKKNTQQKKTMPSKQTKSELMKELGETTKDAIENYVQYADEYADQLGDGPYLKIMDSLKKLHELIGANRSNYHKLTGIAEYWELMKEQGKLCEYMNNKGIRFIECANNFRQIEKGLFKSVIPNSVITEWLNNAPTTYGIKQSIAQSILYYGCEQNNGKYTIKKNKKVGTLEKGVQEIAFFVGGWAKRFQEINEKFTLYDTIRDLLERKPEDADDVKLAVTRAWCFVYKEHIKGNKYGHDEWGSFLEWVKMESELADNETTHYVTLFTTTIDANGNWTMTKKELSPSQ